MSEEKIVKKQAKTATATKTTRTSRQTASKSGATAKKTSSKTSSKSPKVAEMEVSYNIEEQGQLGKVQIADDVVAKIAGLAAGEVDGVYKLTGNITNELATRFGKKNPAKGVKVELAPGKASVEISIEVLYDYSIPKVSVQVQDKVKQAIETMTGLEVDKVNIKIAGVRVNDEN